MRSRVKIRWLEQRAFGVDLPSYVMVPGSWRPLIPNVTHAHGVYPDVDPADPRLNAVTVEVDFPDADGDALTGRPDAKRIRERYRNHPRFGKPDYTPDL